MLAIAGTEVQQNSSATILLDPGEYFDGKTEAVIVAPVQLLTFTRWTTLSWPREYGIFTRSMTFLPEFGDDARLKKRGEFQ